MCIKCVPGGQRTSNVCEHWKLNRVLGLHSTGSSQGTHRRERSREPSAHVWEHGTEKAPGTVNHFNTSLVTVVNIHPSNP